jgi:transcription initiation factor TFIIIB Brf1 subunit/transcription initiation factor TFIIB
MPAFMSLSTGAEAAYGQPFAFTTGNDTGGKGTKQKSGNQKKKAKKANAAKKRKEQAETNTNHTVDPAMAAKIAGAVAAVLTAQPHQQSSKKKQKNTRMHLSVENLQLFQAAKKEYLDQLVDITSDTGVRTFADYQQQKAQAFQTMMTEKIQVLELQSTITYKESPTSKNALKMQEKLGRLRKDNETLHMSKHTVNNEAFPEFKVIMHAYYTAELAASAMKGKERRDALKTAKETKSASLKEWAKTLKTPDTISALPPVSP